MKRITSVALPAIVLFLMMPVPANGEILAMVNYESKPDDSLRAMKLPVGQARREGIAIIDVDPKSKTYGDLLIDMPLPPDLVAHHIFYNKDLSKAYVTALGQPEMRVIDMKRFPYRMRKIAVPGCQVGEDVVFSDDNKTWYLTCMGSNKVIVGDATVDKPIRITSTPRPYPHGIAVHNGIDRMLITSTVRHTDLGDAGETITVLEASTGKTLSNHKVSNKPSPAGAAPVEILFVPGSNPPVAYITNMYGGTLWAAVWDPNKKDFTVQQMLDLSAQEVGVPLEMYFNSSADRLYVTTAKPGHLHVFDISKDLLKPRLVKTLPASEGAHHVAFTKDWRLAFVQNSLLNLPGMSDGSITVVDLQKEEVIGSIDTLKQRGLNPNCIVLLPEWNHLAGH